MRPQIAVFVESSDDMCVEVLSSGMPVLTIGSLDVHIGSDQPSPSAITGRVLATVRTWHEAALAREARAFLRGGDPT